MILRRKQKMSENINRDPKYIGDQSNTQSDEHIPAEYELSDDELNEIFSTTEQIAEGNRVAAIKDRVQVDENAELEKEEIITGVGPSGPVTVAGGDIVSKRIPSEISIFDSDEEVRYEKSRDRKIKELKQNLQLEDSDVTALLSCIQAVRTNDKSFNIYEGLPAKLKVLVNKMCESKNLPVMARHMLAKEIIQSIIDEMKTDASFVDLEEAMDQALAIPSMVDMYSEHTRTIMEENIPKVAESIKDSDPEKAKQLLAIKDSFTKAYTLSEVRHVYETNSKARKTVRRYDGTGKELRRALDDVNYINERSMFKISDCAQIPDILYNILIDNPIVRIISSTIDDSEVATEDNGSDKPIDPEMESTIRELADTEEEYEELKNLPKVNEEEEAELKAKSEALTSRIKGMNITRLDVDKFCIALCKSCENYNPTDLVQSTYVYYLTKNIIVLGTTQEAKTLFAAELISNICDTIAFIRDKEAEFNGNSSNTFRQGKEHDSNSPRPSGT